MVVGTPGGPTIITSVYQVIANVIDQHMTLAAAVEAPRIHQQALPDAWCSTSVAGWRRPV